MLTKILILGLVSAVVTGTHFEKGEYHNAPQPYRFGYEVKDKEGSQYRHEEADGSGSVKGSYGYTDEKGIYREVNYVADKNGFRAEVKTNEPGTANQDPADVKVKADPQIQDIHSVKVTPHIIPVAHEFFSPIQQSKQYRNFNTKNYNDNNYEVKSYNSFSPLHGFKYRPASHRSSKPLLNVGSNYKLNLGRQVGDYNIQTPHYRYNQGFDGLKNLGGLKNLDGFKNLDEFKNIDGFKNLDGFKFDDGEIEKIIDELKNKGRYAGNLEGYGSSDEFGKIMEELRNNGGYSDSLNGFGNNDEIEKILDELKNKGGYSGSNFRGLGGDNDFEFKEYRNLNSGKSSFSRGYGKDDFNL